MHSSLVDPVVGLWLTILVAARLLETLVPQFEHRAGSLRGFARNVVLGAMNSAITVLALSGATAWCALLAERRSIGLLHQVELPSWGKAVVALLALDLFHYLWHRAFHLVPVLWRFHRVHHSDPELCAATSQRFHLLEIASTSAMTLLLVPLLGLTIAQLALYQVILVPVSILHHANVRIPAALDRVLRGILVTPRMHWVHHAKRCPATDTNYAAVFSLWDRLFRTFRMQEPGTYEIGLDTVAPERCRTIAQMLLLPFEHERLPLEHERLPLDYERPRRVRGASRLRGLRAALLRQRPGSRAAHPGPARSCSPGVD